jgi:hypothetical protein
MPRVLDPHRISTDSEYRAARVELDELLEVPMDVPAGARVDELIAQIEDYEGSARCVPDWPDESYQHAA